MDTVGIKLLIRKALPNWLIKPILNLYRVVRFILVEHSNNSKDLKFLHEIQLDRLKANNNQKNYFVQKYSQLHANLTQKELCRAHEFKIFSQHGEDGLIMYIFSKIGVKYHTFIEFGAGGKTSNTENLIVNFGWSGLLIDGNNDALNETKNRYKSNQIPDERVKTLCSWITKDNINELFSKSGFSGEIDLLSIDIDGNDYWVWKEIDTINPRVVVIEYNGSFGDEKAITIQYNETHNKFDFDPFGWYHGASLKALEKLGAQKGYSLLCCDSSGANAFFIRNDLLCDPFTTLSTKEAFYSYVERDKMMSLSEQHCQVINIGEIVNVE